MRHWGIVVTAFYAAVVILLFSFGGLWLADGREAFAAWSPGDSQELLLFALIPTAFLVGGQVLLLFLSVDSSWRRLKPQRHAKVTAGFVGLMVTILAFAILFAIGMAVSGDNFLDSAFTDMTENQVLAILVGCVLLLWAIWGVVFYTFSKRSSDVVDSAVSWLIKGKCSGIAGRSSMSHHRQTAGMVLCTVCKCLGHRGWNRHYAYGRSDRVPPSCTRESWPNTRTGLRRQRLIPIEESKHWNYAPPLGLVP